MGAVSGVATAGVGSMFGPVGSTGLSGEIRRAMAHGHANIMVGMAFGQGPSLAGYASGAMGSLTGSALHSAGTAAQIGGSALTGGLSASIAGGDFWRGAATGATVATFNHAAHAGVEFMKDRSLINSIKKNGWSPSDMSDSKTGYSNAIKGIRFMYLHSRGRMAGIWDGPLHMNDVYDFSSKKSGKGGDSTGRQAIINIVVQLIITKKKKSYQHWR